MGKIDFRLYEFDPAIQAIQDVIESNIDYETGEYIGALPIEELIQEKMNMEKDKQEKILSLAKLVLYYRKLSEDHEELEKKHQRKKIAAEKAADRLRDYIKAFTPEGFKAKDAQVSIYEMRPVRVQPLKPVEEMPAVYRRPSLVKDFNRDVADRINKSCAKQGLPTPFEWEHDLKALKDAAKEYEDAGSQFDLARLESGRAVVVR